MLCPNALQHRANKELVVTGGTSGITNQISQAPLSSEDSARPRQLAQPSWIYIDGRTDRLKLPKGIGVDFPDCMVFAD